MKKFSLFTHLLNQPARKARYYAWGLDFQVWWTRFVKLLPATPAGFIFFTYLYGPVSQRYRGTWVAMRAWYFTLSWPEKSRAHRWARGGRRWLRRWGLRTPRTWVYLTGVARWVVRGGSPRIAPYEVTAALGLSVPSWSWRAPSPEVYLEDHDPYESVFPDPVAEAFQELGLEYFEIQQDAGNDQDEEPDAEGEATWGSREGYEMYAFKGGATRGRHRKLPTRERSRRRGYYPLEEEVETFGTDTPHVNPGDGPTMDDTDQDDPLLSRWDHLADWYHYVTSYKKITQGRFPPGVFTYLLLEHKQTWTPNPGENPRAWYLKTRGVYTWLHRVRRRRLSSWAWAWRYERQERYGRLGVAAWLRRGGDRAGVRVRRRRRRRRTRRELRRRTRRWNQPAIALPMGFNLNYFGQSRHLFRGLRYRFRRLNLRGRRLFGQSVHRRRLTRAFVRPYPLERTYRKVLRHRPRWRFIKLPLRRRSELPRWHVPRYTPLYHVNRLTRSVLPGRNPRGGVLPETGVFLVGAVLAGALLWEVGEYLFEIYVDAFFVNNKGIIMPTGEYTEPGITGYLYQSDHQWTGDFFRRVNPRLHEWWEVSREGLPREQRTTAVYNPFRNTPVGKNWQHNPGLDVSLVQRTSNTVFVPLAVEEFFYVVDEKEWQESFIVKIHNDRRGLFQWHLGWGIPSWAHWDDRIGDGWVNRLDLRWLDGVLEPKTYRRELDHRYNYHYSLGRTFYYYVEELQRLNDLDDLTTRYFHEARYRSLLQYLALPQWVTPRGGYSSFQLAYLHYWGSLTRLTLWPSEHHLQAVAATWDLGNADYSTPIQDTSNKVKSMRWGYHSLPTRWEPHLNAGLIAAWEEASPARVNPIDWDLHHQFPLWWSSPWGVPPRVDYFLRLTALVGAVALWRWRERYLAGLVYSAVGVRPVHRANPGWVARRDRPARAVPAGLRRRRGKRRRRAVRKGFTWRSRSYWAKLNAQLSTWDPCPVDRPGRAVPAAFCLGPMGAHPGVGPHRARWPVRPGRARPARVLVNRWSFVGNFPTGWLVRPVATPVATFKGEVHRHRLGLRVFRWFNLEDTGKTPRFFDLDRSKPERHTRRWYRHRRGWHRRSNPVKHLSRPGRTNEVTRWSWPGRTQQHQWHQTRYRLTLAGVRPLGFAPPGAITSVAAQLGGVDFPGRTTFLERGWSPGPGYDASWSNEAEDDAFIQPGNNGDDEFEEILDWDVTPDEHEGTRFLFPAEDTLHGVNSCGVTFDDAWGRARLEGYRRFGALPRRAYSWGSPAGATYQDELPEVHLHWGLITHPAASVLGPYEFARRARRLGLPRAEPRRRAGWFTAQVYQREAPHGGELLWPTGWDHLHDEVHLTGWALHGGSHLPERTHHDDDDHEGVDFGSLVSYGAGYRHHAGGYLTGGFRPAEVLHQVSPVWSAPTGWDAGRYLVAEDVTLKGELSELTLLEGLTRVYLDGYDWSYLQGEHSNLPETDPDEHLEDKDWEDSDEEVSFSGAVDYPAWVVQLALDGASPGESSATAMSERLSDDESSGFETSHRGLPVFRFQLRHYYRRWRRWKRRPKPRSSFRGWRDPYGSLVNEYVAEVRDDHRPRRRKQVTALTGMAFDPLDHDLVTQEAIRLWALSEVYLGDSPVGAAVDS